MSELPEETGDARVDAVVAGLGRLGDLPVEAHAQVFQGALAELEATLAAVDEPSQATGDPLRATGDPVQGAR
jgi:hypothetical protein